jgi:hypothetical protein
MLTIAAAPGRSTAPLETTLDLVSPDHAVSAAPWRANTLLVTTLELVNHDRPVTSLEMPPARPAPLPASATQSSVPMGPLAAATAEPLSRPAARGPDLNISTAEHDAPGAHDFPEPAKQAGQIAPPPGAMPAPSPAVTTPFDAASVNAGNSACQPVPPSAATAALMVPDGSRLPMHKEIVMAPAQLQALNTAGWKPAVPDRPIEQAPAESVRPDPVSFPSKPIEAAFSAGGDYTQFNPPIHLPRGVIAMSSSAVPTLPHACDSAPSSGSPTTWQTYKPAITDSAMAGYRPLPPGPPIISPQAYALDPSRVIAASSPYAR